VVTADWEQEVDPKTVTLPAFSEAASKTGA
jgi:hypothetical protein